MAMRAAVGARSAASYYSRRTNGKGAQAGAQLRVRAMIYYWGWAVANRPKFATNLGLEKSNRLDYLEIARSTFLCTAVSRVFSCCSWDFCCSGFSWLD